MRSTDELSARAQRIGVVALAREAAERAGIAELYLVGGAVRDLYRGADPVDIDLAVDGDPQALAAALTSTGAQTRFGTVTAHRDGVRYDIARTRTEHYPHPGSLPEVAPAAIEQDLLRRDFTVNAIAFGLLGDHAGEILAVPGAHDDLTAQRLAVLHDASFEDDPTRLLRLARYSARLHFEISPHTRTLAARAIAQDALETISGTRIGNELRLLAAEPDPIAAFVTAGELGLPWTLDADLARRGLDALPADGRSDLVVLAAVFAHGQGAASRPTVHQPSLDRPADDQAAASQRPDLESELDRLSFTAADREAILQAATQASGLAERLSNARSRSEIARAVGTAGIETVALASARGAPDQALLWLKELRNLRLQISGADMISRGVPEGPGVGLALAAAQAALFDGHAPDRESQLAIALRAAQ